MDTGDLGDPFRIPELWRATLPLPSQYKASFLDQFNIDVLPLLDDPTDGYKEDSFKFHPLEDFNGTLQPLEDLPDLQDLHIGRLEDLKPQKSDNAQSEADEVREQEQLGLETWTEVASLQPAKDTPQHLSWERFYGHQTAQHGLQYVSEAGAEVFDILQDSKPNGDSSRVIRSHILLHSLTELILGHESILYRWNDNDKTFETTLEGVKWSGTALQTSQVVIKACLGIGNTIKMLRRFVDTTYAKDPTHEVPARVAFAQAVKDVLEGINAALVEKRSTIRSFVELETLIAKPKALVDILQACVEQTRRVSTGHDLLEAVYSHLTDILAYDNSFCDILKAVLATVAGPMLEQIAMVVGLSPRSADPDDLTLPTFVDVSIQSLIEETCHCDSLLDLAGSRVRSMEENTLKWHFTWDDLDQLHSRNVQAETRACFKPVASSHSPSKDSSPFDPSAFERELLHSIRCLREPLSHDGSHISSLTSVALTQKQEHQNDGPPLELALSLSLTPLLNQQFRRLTHASLHTLLYKHDLKMHLSIHGLFSLCRSGLFVSKLQQTLFSPDFESAERKKGSFRSGHNMGLNLGSHSRKEWPPASSELRMALMNILTDCWQEELDFHTKISRQKTSMRRQRVSNFDVSAQSDQALPISFSIREMKSEEDIQKIFDPQSIYALDFLQLSHTSSRVLTYVFTSRALKMYDRIFSLLLRLMRMSFTVGQLYRDTRGPASAAQATYTQRFKHEATHFFTVLTGYIMNSGIAAPWRDFTRYVDTLHEEYKSPEPTEGKTSTFGSVGELTAKHEATLKKICDNLLLRKKHRDAYNTLEVICNDFLAFAQSVQSNTDEQSVEDLYNSFKTHKALFISNCRDVVAKASLNRKDWADGAKEILEILGAQ